MHVPEIDGGIRGDKQIDRHEERKNQHRQPGRHEEIKSYISLQQILSSSNLHHLWKSF